MSSKSHRKENINNMYDIKHSSLMNFVNKFLSDI